MSERNPETAKMSTHWRDEVRACGQVEERGGNQPFTLDGADAVWWIESGSVDLFSVSLPGEDGSRNPLGHVDGDGLLFGLNLTEDTMAAGVQAVPTADTRLRRVDRAAFSALLTVAPVLPDLAERVDDWLAALLGGIARDINPRADMLLEAGQQVELEAGQHVRSAGGIVWARHSAGAGLFIGMEERVVENGPVCTPLSRRAWMEVLSAGKWEGLDTAMVLAGEDFWTQIDGFHAVVSRCEWMNRGLLAVDELNRLKDKRDYHRKVRLEGNASLGRVLNPKSIPESAIPGGDALLAACRRIGEVLGISIKQHRDAIAGRPQIDPLGDLAKASGLRVREVALEAQWWREDNGPLLGYWHDNSEPVALIPASSTSYDLYALTDTRPRRVDATLAARLKGRGHQFNSPLPDEPVTLRGLLKVGLRRTGRDWARVAVLGLLGGGMSVLLPWATGIVFDQLIPHGSIGQLVMLCVALAVTSLAGAFFQLTRDLSMTRIEGKMDADMQTAIWDRLIRLPARFFQQYSSGELQERGSAIPRIRRQLSQFFVTTVLGGIFGGLNFLMLFIYDVRLALWATLIMLLAVGPFVYSSWRQYPHQWAAAEARGKVEGLVQQLFRAISKIRVSGVEPLVFGEWATAFARYRDHRFMARVLANQIRTYLAVIPLLGTMVFFFLVVGREPPLEVGRFVAFTFAFGVFFQGFVAMLGALTSIVNVVPVYRRIEPVLQEVPETAGAKTDPGTIRGGMELNHLRFRYAEDGPWVIDDVSLSIVPGEFTAVVGPSGAGKSTLMRLMLGFDAPQSGGVLYDGRNMQDLDVKAVRGLMGVVLQNDRLAAGSVMTNLCGQGTYTQEEAWAALRAVGLEEDVKAMPMGIHTMLTGGVDTLSGGQRQRLILARAIISNPRILILDEATSALDNRAQRVVTESLAALQTTRVVIAHRLSTVISADRIVVIDHGKIVEQGTYETLMKRNGLFSTMARRQLAAES